MMDRQRRRRLRRLELWHALRLPKHRRPALGTEVEGRKFSDDRVAGKSFRPASYNFYRATLEKAAMPSALPVRRWQSTQWRIETRLGSPAQRICGRPQAQLATRSLIENFRREPLARPRDGSRQVASVGGDRQRPSKSRRAVRG